MRSRLVSPTIVMSRGLIDGLEFEVIKEYLRIVLLRKESIAVIIAYLSFLF